MKDFKLHIAELLAKDKLTAEDKAFLQARVSYLSPEDIKRLKLDEVEEVEETDDTPVNDDADDSDDTSDDDEDVYLEDMTVAQIKEFAAAEKIDLKGAKTKASMIEVVQAMIAEAAELTEGEDSETADDAE